MIRLPALRRGRRDTPLAARLVHSAELLTQVLTAENAALARFDVPAATALVAEKARALAAFELACLEMEGRTLADPAERRTAEALSCQLEVLARDNRRLLERALAVQKRVLALLARAAARAAPAHYGSQSRGAPGAAALPAGLAFSARA